jgi:protein-tyrosine phosphatase
VRRWVRRLTRRRGFGLKPGSRAGGDDGSLPRSARQLVFEGMVNFRDLGGIPADGGTVRRGVLFRSDSLAYATEADARRLVEELGVLTVIDLRGQYEVDHLGRGPLVDAGVAYIGAPIVDVSVADDLSGHYLAMLHEKGAVLAGMIKLLATGDALPAVFHCEAGCDRTGVLAAAVLSLLGVAEDAIAEDYALTAPAMPAIHARVREVALRLGLPTRPGVAVEWTPEAAMMAGALKLARERWGGMREWAREYGVTDEDVEALRTALLV